MGLPFSSRSRRGNVTKSASCLGLGTRAERRVGPKLSLPLIGGDESRSESSSSSEEWRRERFLRQPFKQITDFRGLDLRKPGDRSTLLLENICCLLVPCHQTRSIVILSLSDGCRTSKKHSLVLNSLLLLCLLLLHRFPNRGVAVVVISGCHRWFHRSVSCTCARGSGTRFDLHGHKISRWMLNHRRQFLEKNFCRWLWWWCRGGRQLPGRSRDR